MKFADSTTEAMTRFSDSLLVLIKELFAKSMPEIKDESIPFKTAYPGYLDAAYIIATNFSDNSHIIHWDGELRTAISAILKRLELLEKASKKQLAELYRDPNVDDAQREEALEQWLEVENLRKKLDDMLHCSRT